MGPLEPTTVLSKMGMEGLTLGEIARSPSRRAVWKVGGGIKGDAGGRLPPRIQMGPCAGR
jgi:hypothetical protein